MYRQTCVVQSVAINTSGLRTRTPLTQRMDAVDKTYFRVTERDKGDDVSDLVVRGPHLAPGSHGGAAVRTLDCQLRESGFESSCCRFEAWAVSFTPRCPSSLSCIKEYLVTDWWICERMLPREVEMALELTSLLKLPQRASNYAVIACIQYRPS